MDHRPDTKTGGSATPAPNASSNGYTPLEVVADPDGVVAVITERDKDGRVSFAIFREYEERGETKRTSYLARRHIAAVRRLCNDLEERLEQAEDRARARKR